MSAFVPLSSLLKQSIVSGGIAQKVTEIMHALHFSSACCQKDRQEVIRFLLWRASGNLTRLV